MQCCIYYKYYMKIKKIILKNKVHLYKRLKIKLWMNRKISSKIKYTQFFLNLYPKMLNK